MTDASTPAAVEERSDPAADSGDLPGRADPANNASADVAPELFGW